MIVVADTTPLNYLVLIHQADLLPQLFGHVLIPPAVFAELHDPSAPGPDLDRRSTTVARGPRSPYQSRSHARLPGLRGAIALAEQVHADQLLVDESEARREAGRRKLPFMGTLGVLRQAARRGLVDLAATLAGLQATTFYVDPALISYLLEEEAVRKKWK